MSEQAKVGLADDAIPIASSVQKKKSSQEKSKVL